MGRTHIAAMASVRGIELIASVDRDFEAVLKNPDIDAVDLCVPTDLHASFAIEALRSGKHVLVEKPMALDGAACDRMIAEARVANRVLMVAHVLRFAPAYQGLQQKLQNGGPVRAASFRRRSPQPGWADWLLDPCRSGGGVFDFMIHDVDMALHLFGPPLAIAATGSESSCFDVIHAQLFYEEFAVEVAGGWHHRDSLPFSMEYTVVTEDATLTYNSLTEAAAYNAYAAEIDYFACCCRNGGAPELCPPEESAHAVRLTRALADARKRNGEKLPWPN